MIKIFKKAVKHILGKLGYEVRHKSVKRPGTGSLEEVLRELRERGLACTSILDVGASNSCWSRRVKKIFPEAKFFLVEPQVEFKKDLEAFCNEYPESKYFSVAAASQCGELILTRVPPSGISSTCGLPESPNLVFHGREGDLPQKRIPAVTIDYLLKKNRLPMPELIKLDILGFELEALKGASAIFGHAEIFILSIILFPLEIKAPSFGDVVLFMKEKGYALYDFVGFAHRPFDGALIFLEVVFCKRDGFLRSHPYWT